MAAYDFEIGKHYTFSSTIPVEFGESFVRVKFEGKVGYEIARLHENVDQRHRRVFHHLENAVDNPAAYQYYIFSGDGKSKVVLAEPWIDHNSVSLVESVSVNIVVENIKTADVDIIRKLLLSGGYTAFTLKTL